MYIRRLLLPLVFVGGMASLGVEFAASRLLAPYFGDSLYVWGVLIGLILLYLSAGYVIGGRIADRWPNADLLFQMTAWAGAWIGFTPIVSYPLLLASLRGFATLSAGLVLGTLLSVVLLFAVPVILLGCVSPFAIRLLLRDVETGGDTAGRVYALSTAGSIFGTFLPVFVLIPQFGTRVTLLGFGVVLLVVALLGLLPRRKYVAVLLVAVLAAAFLLPHGVRPAETGKLLYEKESAYNYIQVVKQGDRTDLLLNEGQAVHSIYDPTTPLTGGPWDYMLLGPAFRKAQRTEARPTRVLVLGLAGGTAARQYELAYGNSIHITGVELDPDILAAGQRYFHLDQPQLRQVTGDARSWLTLQPAQDKYDVVIVDAYRQPYIPFQMTTHEFFDLVRQHLAPGGVAIVNAGRTQTDYRLVDALASTMRATYDNVYLLDVPAFTNTVIYGTTEQTSVDDVRHNLQVAQEPLVREVAQSAEDEGNLRASPYRGQVYTDDRAPVERLIDSIIFQVATGGG